MGQIKNIKLHIVTDIKSLKTFSIKMAYTSDAQFEQVDPYAETEAPPAAKKQRTDNRTDNRFCEQDDVIVLKEKVFIPVEQHPGYNFVGSILGPSGSILKELTKATKSKIAILGKGSMKDKTKEEELLTSDEKEHPHLINKNNNSIRDISVLEAVLEVLSEEGAVPEEVLEEEVDVEEGLVDTEHY